MFNCFKKVKFYKKNLDKLKTADIILRLVQLIVLLVIKQY